MKQPKNPSRLVIHYVYSFGQRPACNAMTWYMSDRIHVTCKNCIRVGKAKARTRHSSKTEG